MYLWLLIHFLSAHHHHVWAARLASGHYTWAQLHHYTVWAVRHGFSPRRLVHHWVPGVFRPVPGFRHFR